MTTVSQDGSPATPRPLPVLTPENLAFFTAGKDGRLMIHRCARCGYYVHPPAPVCAECLSVDVAPEAVSGRGTVYTYTVSEYLWHPAFPPPYIIAAVALDEQPSVRLTTNVVGCEPAALWIGMPVRATFLDCGEIFLPLFEPVPDSGGVGAGAAEPDGKETA